MNRSAPAAASTRASVHSVSPEKASARPPVLDPQGVAGGAGGMDDLEGGHAKAVDLGRDAFPQLDDLHLEGRLAPGGGGVERLLGLAQPVGESRRARQGERFRAAGAVVRVAEQERQAAEVVAVQVGDQDGADGRRFDAAALHRRERRGAAVEQRRRQWTVAGLPAEQEAGVQPAAAAEGVAAAQHLKPERHAGSRSRSCAATPAAMAAGALERMRGFPIGQTSVSARSSRRPAFRSLCRNRARLLAEPMSPT